MEAIGLLLGLAPLFSICLEYFEYFNTAQALSPDLEVLLLKMDLEHERFIAWGEANGISKPSGEGRNSELDSTSKENLVKRSLECIEALFKNGEKLKAAYGVLALDENAPNEPLSKLPSSSGLSRFRKSYAKLLKGTKAQTQPGLLSRRVINKERDKIVFKDIRSLLFDLERLKLVETASEDAYPTSSEAASLIIVASESGTAHGQGSVRKWVEELDNSTENEPEIMSTTDARLDQASLKFDIPYSRWNLKTYLVFTSKCSSIYSESCNEATVGLRSVGKNALDFLTDNGRYKPWSLSKTIAKDIKTSFEPTDLEMLRQLDGELSETQELVIEYSFPTVKVDLFCAPCACAIHTAVRLCNFESSKLISYITKIDDRIPTSCCAQSAKLRRLNALLAMMQEHDAAVLANGSEIIERFLEHIDRAWLEQRIFHLETESFDSQEVAKSDQLGVAELLKSIPSQHVIILGEADRCLWILQTAPFPWTPRMPKENEIYSLKYQAKHKWSKTYLGSFAPRNFVANAASVRDAAASKVTYSRVYSPAIHAPPLQTPLSDTTSAKRQKKIWDTKTESPSTSQQNYLETGEKVLDTERTTNVSFLPSLVTLNFPQDPPQSYNTEPPFAQLWVQKYNHHIRWD